MPDIKNFNKIMQEAASYDKEALRARGYTIKDRKFMEIKAIMNQSRGYREFYFPCGDECVVYSGAEHTSPKKPDEKLPNITFLPNYDWQQREDFWTVLGSTLGHQHLQKQKGDARRFQEIYEFMTLGAMLLRNPEEPYARLHILAPKEKILVGTRDNMTIFNLGKNPLLTLDYANPLKNSASKDLENRIGPMLMAGHPLDMHFAGIFRTEFRLNPSYAQECVIAADTKGRESHTIHVNGELGCPFYHSLTEGDYDEDFRKIGVRLVKGGNLPKDLKAEFSKPLLQLILEKNKALIGGLGI